MTNTKVVAECSICKKRPAVGTSPTGHLHCQECLDSSQELCFADDPTSPQPGTLADLLTRDIEPIRFVIDDLVPEGLTMLAGRPKLGKSWLALGMSLSVCAGIPALGHNTTAAEVLYIALEDGERRLQDRVRRLGGENLGDAKGRFHYRTEWPALNNGGLDALREWVTDHPGTRLVVLDPFGKGQGALPGKNRYTEEYELLGGLQSFTSESRVALVLIHHLRKQGADDWLEQLSGSQAVTGSADTLLGLFRERGQMDATLRLVSREVPEKDLALRFDGGRWQPMGDAATYRYTVERSQVLDGLVDLGGQAKVSEIAELIEKTSANTSKLLINLANDGAVRKVSYGVYSLPVEPVELGKLASTTSTTSTREEDHRGSEAHR